MAFAQTGTQKGTGMGPDCAPVCVRVARSPLCLCIACLALQLSVCFGSGPAVVSLQAHALEIRTGEESR